MTYEQASALKRCYDNQSSMDVYIVEADGQFAIAHDEKELEFSIKQGYHLVEGGRPIGRNYFQFHIMLNRIDVCHLMQACHAAMEMANDDGMKWKYLYEKLKMQLYELDRQLDMIEQNGGDES